MFFSCHCVKFMYVKHTYSSLNFFNCSYNVLRSKALSSPQFFARLKASASAFICSSLGFYYD